MAAFSGEAVLVSTVYEGAVRLDGTVATASPEVSEGGVRLAGEAISESYQYVYPILQPEVLTGNVAWSPGTVVPVVQPAVLTSTLAWASGVVVLQAAPTVTTSTVAWASGVAAPAVAPSLGPGAVVWQPGVVTTGGAVQPPVTTGEVAWAPGVVRIPRPAKRPAAVFGAGPANPLYVDILRQGEEVPERTPDNVYVFKPPSEAPMTFEHRPTERRLMVAGVAYAPATVNLWMVGLTALVLGSVFWAATRKGR